MATVTRKSTKEKPVSNASASLDEGQAYATPALEKGLDILELLAHQTEGLTKSQLARELNRSVSEIFRMLVCLERRGYIAQTAEDRYSLTLKLFQLVQQHPPTERLIVEALPVMKQLVQQTQQSCHLGVIELEQVVILAQINSPTHVGFYVKLGSTVNLMESSTGYVILAHQVQEERERTIAAWCRRNNKKVPGDLAGHLERIRQLGYEKRQSYLVKGIVNISFPILGQRGAALGAITIPYIQYSHSTVPEAEVIVSLRNAARQVSVAIGGNVVSQSHQPPQDV